ncbi:MAG: ISL3 family transposase [Candidatus Uhrbacteria bacterium]|nr:ISL3 family transposase [Candidatus Uhrbacteria bacterium]
MQNPSFSTLDVHYATALNLTVPWIVESVDMNVDGMTLDIGIEYSQRTAPCTECGKTCPVEDLREERSWRHLDMMQFVTTIRCRVPRSRCKEHGVKTIVTPWAGALSHFTSLFERFAVEVLQATTNVTAATKILRVSWHQAQLLMEHAVARGLSRRDGEAAIPHVGLDEKSFLKGHHYASLATDLDLGRVLDVEEGRKEENAIMLLKRAVSERQRKDVQAGAMDMWEPFMKAWRSVMGEEAPIVHDKFHVAGYLGKAVDLVRRTEHRQLRKEGKETLTRTKYLWLKSPENWKDEEREQFNALMQGELKVGRAWALKESFRGFWEYARGWSALRFFKRWYFHATHSRLQPMIDVARTLKRHLDGLLAYVEHRITNAVTEGLNSKIQAVKASARGFRSFVHYRIAILFHCGKLEMFP